MIYICQTYSFKNQPLLFTPSQYFLKPIPVQKSFRVKRLKVTQLVTFIKIWEVVVTTLLKPFSSFQKMDQH